jgi:uncharacterized protein (TIGR04255 family)
MADQDLPEYDAPPVDEVALALALEPIRDFKVPHFGLYWETIRAGYPRCDTQPPLPQQLEPFQPLQPMNFQFISDPNAIRCWFLDASGNNLIQLQPDKFILNWRQAGDKGDIQPYPRYATLRRAFERKWTDFRSFLSENEIAAPKSLQCELTYVNSLERGKEWDNFADLARIASFWNGMPPNTFLSAPESANINLSYAMENPPDHLRVTFQHALRVRDGKDVLQVNLVCRMKLETDDDDKVMAKFDQGHEWIVRAFTGLTTPEMHTFWKRRI